MSDYRQIPRPLTLFLNSILLAITVFPLLRYIQIYGMLKFVHPELSGGH